MIGGVLLAAGAGSRFRAAGGGKSVQSTSADGLPSTRAPCSPDSGSCAQSVRGIATGCPLRSPS